MVQFLEQQMGLGGVLGQALGQGIGGGISSGLELLASQKLQGLKDQRTAKALAALGLPPEAAALDPRIHKELVAQKGRETQMSLLSQLLGGGGGGGEGIEEEEFSARGPGEEVSDTAILAASQINPAIGRALQSQKDSRQRQKLSAFKETKEFRKEVRDEAKGARENVARLNRMSVLVDKGKLTNPLIYSTLNKFGLDMPVLLSPDSQEFQKLTVDFLRDARKVFGARVTNYEAQQFLKAIPSLLQTEDGKKRVIRNLKTLAKGAEVRAKETQNVLRENDGNPPLDLAEQVEDRVDAQLGRLYDRFAQGIGTDGVEVAERVTIVLPDGRRGTVPKGSLKDALKRGAKRG